MKAKKSARNEVEQYVDELIRRREDRDRPAKLLAMLTIASRMNWIDIFKKIKATGLHFEILPVQPIERKEQWWEK